MKKILVFAQTAVGGAERMSVTVTKTLDRSRFEIIYYLVGPVDNGHAPLEAFIPSNMKVNIITSQSPISLIARMFWILVKEKPDVVFASVINLNNKLLLLRPLFKKIKFIARCDNYLYTYNDKQRKIIDKTYPRADIIIAQTEEMKQELIDEMHISEEKVVALMNPVDSDTIDRMLKEGTNPYSGSGKIRYVASGRFAYQKGFDILVEAFRLVKDIQPNAELYIVGRKDGGCEDCYHDVENIIESKQLKDSVFCIGFQNNPYVYIKYADCFVLSSRWEGLPNVMIESLYLGTPVAAVKCIPVIERIVTVGKDGYLADKENIESLSKAMLSASKLGRITSTYKSASIQQFHHILEYATKPNGGGKKSIIFNKLYSRAHGGKRFWNVLYHFYTQYVLGCDIPASTVIGEGFELYHSAHASVISPGTIIGRNVSLRQNTTIGAKGFQGAEKSPVIEDDVTIGPNVCIIGDITIGKGATIGAGAVVVKDVPPYSVVVGNPARVIVRPVGGGKRLRFKYLVSLTPPVSWYLAITKHFNDKKLLKLREPYIPKLSEIVTPDTSIISSNCFAGRIMQDLGMQYNTPTLGLYFFADDYIEFLRNLKYYLTEAKLEFLDQSRYPLANERRKKWSHWYPIGLLGGKVEIQFLHYHSETEAAEKWYRRAARVNWDKLFIIGMEQNLCTEDCIRAFDKLNFERKLFFSSKDLPDLKSNCFLELFAEQGEVGDPYQKADVYYREFTKKF